MKGPSNDEMQLTSHGQNEGSQLISGWSQVNDATFSAMIRARSSGRPDGASMDGQRKAAESG